MRHARIPLALTQVATLAAFGSTEDTPMAEQPNLVALAQSNPNLSILVEAVVAAKLQDALSATGPFTVFLTGSAW